MKIFFKVNFMLTLIVLAFPLSSYVGDSENSSDYKEAAKNDYDAWQAPAGTITHAYSVNGGVRQVFYTTFRYYLVPGGYIVGKCSEGLFFNCNIKACDWPDNRCSCLR